MEFELVALGGTFDIIHVGHIALLENGQRPDGSVSIPQVLHPYTGFDIIEPN